MPRKVRVPADPTKNRESQQRSRARRRAHVAALEARVRELEDGGVRATLAMQRAAREVAWVNGRLTALLAARGVSGAEVDAFLRRCREEKEAEGKEEEEEEGRRRSGSSAPSHAETSRTELVGCGGGVVVVGDGDGNMRDIACDDARTGEGVVVEPRRRMAEERGDVVVVRVCDGTTTRGSATNAIHRKEAEEEEEVEEGGKEEAPRALLTRCDDAANIIAGFQGHGDVSRVREVLGCGGDAATCHVRNTRLFQLMDETAG